MTGTRTGFVGILILFLFFLLQSHLSFQLSFSFLRHLSRRSLFILLSTTPFVISLFLFSSRLQIFASRLLQVTSFFQSVLFSIANNSDISVAARSLSVISSQQRFFELFFFTGYGFNNSHPYIYEGMLPSIQLSCSGPSLYDGSIATWFQLPWDYGIFFFLLSPLILFHFFRFFPPVLILIYSCWFSLSLFNFFWFYFLLLFFILFSILDYLQV